MSRHDDDDDDDDDDDNDGDDGDDDDDDDDDDDVDDDTDSDDDHNDDDNLFHLVSPPFALCFSACTVVNLFTCAPEKKECIWVMRIAV